MPSNPVPNLSQRDLKQLHKLLHFYRKRIDAEQPLAGDIIGQVADWVRDDIDPPDGQNSYTPRYKPLTE